MRGWFRSIAIGRGVLTLLVAASVPSWAGWGAVPPSEAIQKGRTFLLNLIQLQDVRRRAHKLIRTEVVTDRVLEGWQEYADLLLMACIAEGGRPDARPQHDLHCPGRIR